MSLGARCTFQCNIWVVVAMLGCMVATTGCKSGGGSSSASQASATSSSSASSVNQAPTISGSPGAAVAAGQKYTFAPVAADADGDTLGFSIANRPTWAQFDTSTGRLTGTPSDSHVGPFANIQISVSDGKVTSSLPAFSLKVAASGTLPTPGSGAATLSWSAPTENTDGSTLTNLSGYRIRYGKSPTELTSEITLHNAGITTYMVTDLPPATYYFAVKAVNAAGAESSLSTVASKTIT
jgi:hypothetical protein